jgi:hypothetical protein
MQSMSISPGVVRRFPKEPVIRPDIQQEEQCDALSFNGPA